MAQIHTLYAFHAGKSDLLKMCVANTHTHTFIHRDKRYSKYGRQNNRHIQGEHKKWSYTDVQHFCISVRIINIMGNYVADFSSASGGFARGPPPGLRPGPHWGTSVP